MEKFEFKDVMTGDHNGALVVNPVTGRVHVHVTEAGRLSCNVIDRATQVAMRNWLTGRLGDALPAVVMPSPTLRWTETLGDSTSELVWEGALPSAEDFRTAVRAVSGEDDDVTPAQLIDFEAQEQREKGPSLYSEIVAGISQTLRAHDPESRGVPLATRVVQLVADLKAAEKSLKERDAQLATAREAMTGMLVDLDSLHELSGPEANLKVRLTEALISSNPDA